jgi:hypothetical protein
MSQFMYAEKAWNIADLGDDAEESTSVTVTGAALGDFVIVSLDIDVEQGSLTAQVLSANTVECTYINSAVDPSDLAAATVRVLVIAAGSFS